MRAAGFLFIMLLTACSRSPHEGYKIVADEVHLRYIALGDGERVPADEDSLLLRFRASPLNEEPGSLWSTERWYLAREIRSGALSPALRRMHAGDSMSVIAPARLWPWAALVRGDLPAPHDTLTLRTEIALLETRTPEEARRCREELRAEDPEAFERMLIAAFIANDSSGWKRWGTSDLHCRIAGLATDTTRWAYHAPLLLRWEGFDLATGRRIDATENNGGDFAWSYGTPDQLLEGLEVSVSLLREGQRGEFILPARMAFGERGLAGALEPHAPVRYVLSVRPAPAP